MSQTAIPTPMDAWRAALDVLIACAPGSEVSVAWHLSNARLANWAQVDRSAATPGGAALVDRLMLLAAGGLISQSCRSAEEPRNAFGFTHRAPLLGIDFSADAVRERQPVAQPAAASIAAREALEALLASSQPAASVPRSTDQSPLAAPSLLQEKAMPEREHSSAPRSVEGESLGRPSDESPCQ